MSVDPWTPRFLRVYGTAELVERQGRFGPARYMRITPEISWSSNLDGRSSTDGNRTSGAWPAAGPAMRVLVLIRG
ncbi:MAG TPA: hypothetical protein VGS06_05020 [Streptosporangiaceae bacterium]|nr:hypothetical protein [Streptosporangiaceae bacterium]